MANFDKVAAALAYIDAHLDDSLDYRRIAETFHFSPYYFHRIFTAVVGKPMAAYIRDRRLLRACRRIAATNDTILSICLECGFDSAQAFARAFKSCYGITPRAYRRLGCAPVEVSVDELIVKFTNRLKGGVLVTPNIVKKPPLLIAGVTGDGSKTADLWQRFMALNDEIGLSNKQSDCGYEIRIHKEDVCTCHVGVAVNDGKVADAFSLFRLPASRYASFDVYVAKGYESENSAIHEWLGANKGSCAQRLYDGAPYIIEFYDERFDGDSKDSIVEIWVPIEDLPKK